MRRRVVVTGMGMVNPLGCEVEQVWKALLEGRSGVGKITIFDASDYPTKIAAEIRNFTPPPMPAEALWSPLARHSQFAIGAAHHAVEQSGVLDRIDRRRIGVYLGAGEGNQNFARFAGMMQAGLASGPFDVSQFMRNGFETLDAMAELEQEPNMPAAFLATMFDVQGPMPIA